jgi:hypothetical protein
MISKKLPSFVAKHRRLDSCDSRCDPRLITAKAHESLSSVREPSDPTLISSSTPRTLELNSSNGADCSLGQQKQRVGPVSDGHLIVLWRGHHSSRNQMTTTTPVTLNHAPPANLGDLTSGFGDLFVRRLRVSSVVFDASGPRASILDAHPLEHE